MDRAAKKLGVRHPSLLTARGTDAWDAVLSFLQRTMRACLHAASLPSSPSPRKSPKPPVSPTLSSPKYTLLEPRNLDSISKTRPASYCKRPTVAQSP